MKLKQFIKRNIVTIVGAGISVVMVVYFCASAGFDTLAKTITEIDPVWLLAALGSMLLYWVFESISLHILVKRFNPERTFWRSFRVAMIGQLYNAVTPFASGGQPMQIYEMTVNDGMSAGAASSIIARRSLIFQMGVTVMSVLSIGYAFSFFNKNISSFTIITLVGIGLNLVYLFGLLILSKSRKLTHCFTNFTVKLLTKLRIVKDATRLHDRIDAQLDTFHKSSNMFSDSVWAQALSFLMTFVELVFYFLVPYCIYRCFGLVGVPVMMIIAAGAYVYMISAFMPLPGGSGAAEGSFYMLFMLFFNSATIASGMLLWRTITYYACFIAGALVMTLVKKRKQKAVAAKGTRS